MIRGFLCTSVEMRDLGMDMFFGLHVTLMRTVSIYLLGTLNTESRKTISKFIIPLEV